MKQLSMLITIASFLLITGCYPGISGRVVDGMTGKPLEGALVVALWTKTHGIFGMQYHDFFKINETLTNKKGEFALDGTNDLFVEPPEMIIYEEGYIPWRNDMIFPSLDTVKGNEWNNNVTYKLDIFTGKYTFRQLHDFLNYGMLLGLGLKEAPMFNKITNEISTKADKEKDNKPIH
jgi:hypothetical protein